MHKILVVDDDNRMVRLLTLTLPDTYRVMQATDGAQAMDIVTKDVPDLILLDINMPGLNGFEVLQRVKQSATLRNAKVIMVTGRANEEDRNLAMQLGADLYLTKPFSPLSLLEKVTQLLGSK